MGGGCGLPCVVSTLKHCEVAHFEVVTYCVNCVMCGNDPTDEINQVSKSRANDLMRVQGISYDTTHDMMLATENRPRNAIRRECRRIVSWGKMQLCLSRTVQSPSPSSLSTGQS